MISQHFLKICRGNVKFDKNLKRIMGTLHKDLDAFIMVKGKKGKVRPITGQECPEGKVEV
jgi:hypothetical protein